MGSGIAQNEDCVIIAQSRLKQAVLGMPNIRCTRCGDEIYIDAFALPYEGEIACKNCHNIMDFRMGINTGTNVKAKYPNPAETIGGGIWMKLQALEQQAFLEAALSLGSEAYTASEFMSLRSLESVSRRCYMKLAIKPQPSLDWFTILDILGSEPAFKPYSEGINYFRDVRNKIAHLDKISSKLEAESSYAMALRLTKELIEKFSP